MNHNGPNHEDCHRLQPNRQWSQPQRYPRQSKRQLCRNKPFHWTLFAIIGIYLSNLIQAVCPSSRPHQPLSPWRMRYKPGYLRNRPAPWPPPPWVFIHNIDKPRTAGTDAEARPQCTTEKFSRIGLGHLLLALPRPLDFQAVAESKKFSQDTSVPVFKSQQQEICG